MVKVYDKLNNQEVVEKEVDLLLNKEVIRKLEEAEQDIKEGRIRKWEEFLEEAESESRLAEE